MKRCTCGLKISPSQYKRHLRQSTWHREYRRIRALRRAGFSLAYIAEAVGTSHTYVFNCLKKSRHAPTA